MFKLSLNNLKMSCSVCRASTSKLVNGMCVDCYLDNYRPSKVENIPWVISESFKQGKPWLHEHEKTIVNVELAKAIRTHNFKKDEKKNGFVISFNDEELFVPFSVDAIDDLAVKSGILSGKWLIYRERAEIDPVWKMVGKATFVDELGGSAKVSTIYQNKTRHAICVYTKIYLDLGDVERIREKLYDMGFTENLCYKPDIYTYLGIYYRTTSLSACRYRK